MGLLTEICFHHINQLMVVLGFYTVWYLRYEATGI